MYNAWEENLLEAMKKLNKRTEYVQFEIFCEAALAAAFSDDLNADLALIQIAIMLVVVYTVFVLGTVSPMHCRLIVSLMGILCVGIAYAAGFGLCFYLGGYTAGVHNLMPFLLIGIGVDDMFVVCNAIDQTDLKETAHMRIRKAMMHAGPSITITSLTNALAFAFGSLNSLTALRSFCVFASVCIVMLYGLVMTVFLAVVIWDTERVGRKRNECCGCFCCKQESVICCRGWFLSDK
jgi:Niemann-Pick C1 protein